MKKVGIIAPIMQEPTGDQTTKNSLLRVGRTRTPGTGIYMTPDKELSGKYRTGLDENSADVLRIKDKETREVKQAEIKTLREELEHALGVDLNPRSEFWDNGKKTSEYDTKHVSMLKLGDQDNAFNLEDPMEKLNFTWLSASRRIASSLQAYRMGEYPNAQFYVVDKDTENKIAYSKKKEINKAVGHLEELSVEKRKKVARVMGLPVSDDTSEDEVYNLIDNALKQTEIKSGDNKGANPVNVFNEAIKKKESEFEAEDLIRQLLSHNVLRKKEEGIFRGEAKIAPTKGELVKLLISDDDQELRLSLESQLRTKKLIKVS